MKINGLMALMKKSIHQDTVGRCDNERMAHVSLGEKSRWKCRLDRAATNSGTL
jgi:hypothetical protein